MRNLQCLVIIMACALTMKAQMPSSCSVPQVLQTYYDRDVKHLALTRIFAHQSPYKDSINIPQNYQDTIWQGLSAIFNLTSLNERDSVFDIYCIHQTDNIVYKSIFVGVDQSYGWTQQWQNLNTVTGITALDNLLSTYGFTITHFSNTIHYATLTTSQNINITPLCDSIEYFAGVNYAEFVPNYGAGNEISYEKVGNDRFYNFTVGYGDCPSMCTSKHIYKFKVYDNCSVDYLGILDYITPGDVLPTPVNCNITTKIENQKIKTNTDIYPNPANDRLNIDIEENAELEIINMQGQRVDSRILYEKTNNIDISNLVSGVYTLRIKTDKGIAMRKLIKQ